jgi:hypothetical protein
MEQISKADANKTAAATGLIGTTGGGVFAFFLFQWLHVDQIIQNNIYGPGYALAILFAVAGIVICAAVFLLPDSTVASRKALLWLIVATFAALMFILVIPFAFITGKNAPVSFYAAFEPDLSEANTTDVALVPMVKMNNQEKPLSQQITITPGGSFTLELKKLDTLLQRYATNESQLTRDVTTLKDMNTANAGLQKEVAKLCLDPGPQDKDLCGYVLGTMER